MGIKEILGKLIGEKQPYHKGVSGDEVELRSYLDEERAKLIKQRVALRRYQKSREILLGDPEMFNKGKSFMAARNVFNSRGAKIL